MKKTALCIGINDYPGSGSDLHGCVNDAHDWSNALTQLGFECSLLLDADADGNNIRSAVIKLTSDAEAGDVAVITFSGHGSFIPDAEGDERDGFDECWCPHDIVANGPIVDDELEKLFGQRADDVRLAVISDSCHSGTVSRYTPINTPPTSRALHAPQRLVRFLPPGVFMDNIPFKSDQKDLKIRSGAKKRKRSTLLMSGCRDPEFSYDAWFDGRANGAFTFVALRELRNLPTDATYQEWYDAVTESLPSQQYPQSPQLYGKNSMKNWIALAAADETKRAGAIGPVRLAQAEELEEASQLGRSLARGALSKRPIRSARTRSRRIPILAEGDSWFDLPVVADLIDCLEDEHGYDVESVARAGHTIDEMASEEQFLGLVRALQKMVDRQMPPQAIILSGGGNDVAGRTFSQFLNHRSSATPGLRDEVVDAVLRDVIMQGYSIIIGGINEVCQDLLGKTVPIVTHGYSYAVPDGRGFRLLLEFAGPWLRPGLDVKGYDDEDEMHDIVVDLIDRLNAAQKAFAESGPFNNVRHVDLRADIPSGENYKKWWRDELHLTKKGYKVAAKRFAEQLRT